MSNTSSETLGSAVWNHAALWHELSHLAQRSTAEALTAWAQHVARHALNYLAFGPEAPAVRPTDEVAVALASLFSTLATTTRTECVSVLRRGAAWRAHGLTPPEVLPVRPTWIVVPAIDDKGARRLLRMPVDAPGVSIRHERGADDVPALTRLRIQATPLATAAVSSEDSADWLVRHVPDYLLWQTGLIDGMVQRAVADGHGTRQRLQEQQADLRLAAQMLASETEANGPRHLSEVLRLRLSYIELALDAVQPATVRSERLRNEAAFLTRLAPAHDSVQTRRAPRRGRHTRAA